MAVFQTIDDYIATRPEAIRPTLEDVRRTIRKAVPATAQEGISYGIPAIRLDGEFIVWFAVWTQHISLYPIPAGDPALSAELTPYRAGKGTLKFPLASPIPLDVIGRVAAELARERLARER